MSPTSNAAADERLRRWRLVLGDEARQPLGEIALGEADAAMDRALEALYDADGKGASRKGGLGASAPSVARWLGDIRTYFPSSVVHVMQKDALERLGLQQMLLEPEMLREAEPDVHLVANLLSLNRVIPERTRETARAVVRKDVDDPQKRHAEPVRRAVTGSLSRATRNRRPRLAEIDWHRTIRANLHHYDPESRTVVPETLVGHGRRRSSLRDVVLCIDQSGSMATSVVYSSVFGAVLASMRAVTTRMVVFDTAVVDLTDELHDPVDLLFGTQLGGGTDINRALSYCQTLVTRPAQTVLVLVTDLFEGGDADEMIKRAAALAASGVRMVCLLALSDAGAPVYDGRNAARLAPLGVPTFACTPDLFPDLMAAALQKRDLGAWAAKAGIAVARGEP
jgi:Mg-chelatase subunit ChlD